MCSVHAAWVLDPEELPQQLEVGLASGSPQSQECLVPAIANPSLLSRAQAKIVSPAHMFSLSQHPSSIL